MIKRDLTVDWTNNEIIKARIRANVKLLLLRKRFPIEHNKKMLDSIFQQASSLYGDFVPVLT